MTPIDRFPYIRMVNSTGSLLTVVGGAGDPWLVTGPAGAEITRDVTVPFVKGFANFSNMLFTKEGSGYSLKFELTYPKELTMDPITTEQFDVKARPLGLVLGDIPDQLQENENIEIPYYIYDMGLNEKATPQVLGSKTWDCQLEWDYTVQVKIEGTKFSAIDKAGENTGKFVVHFKNSRVSVRLRATCTDQTGEQLVAKSKTFNVFPDVAGKTGLFSLQTTAIKYSGPFTFIKSVIDSVPPVALKKCEGASCPQVVSRRRRQAPAVRVSNGSRLNLASYQMQANPVCLGPQGDLTCN